MLHYVYEAERSPRLIRSPATVSQTDRQSPRRAHMVTTTRNAETVDQTRRRLAQKARESGVRVRIGSDVGQQIRPRAFRDRLVV